VRASESERERECECEGERVSERVRACEWWVSERASASVRVVGE
jgi:hypothetical protein